VISDVICPWCFIGKRRLEKAIAAVDSQHDFRVRWRPFQLNPSMPKEGISRREYRTSKFGSWERSKERMRSRRLTTRYGVFAWTVRRSSSSTVSSRCLERSRQMLFLRPSIRTYARHRGGISASSGLDLSKNRRSVKTPPNRFQTGSGNCTRSPRYILPADRGARRIGIERPPSTMSTWRIVAPTDPLEIRDWNFRQPARQGGLLA
jgi:hypothetical protein